LNNRFKLYTYLSSKITVFLNDLGFRVVINFFWLGPSIKGFIFLWLLYFWYHLNWLNMIKRLFITFECKFIGFLDLKFFFVFNSMSKISFRFTWLILKTVKLPVFNLQRHIKFFFIYHFWRSKLNFGYVSIWTLAE
jgi:hypothetical protein